MSNRMPDPQQVFRAIDLYVAVAYPQGAPPKVGNIIGSLRSAPDLYSASEFVRTDDSARPKLTLRLGNSVYPHMKLAIEPTPGREQYIFRADTHDRHIEPRPGHPEREAFEKLRQSNQRLSEEIEKSWEQSGLPTFKSFLEQDLARRKGEEPAPPGPRPHKHTILVVDDEPYVVKSVQDLLRMDYRVLGVTRAADAIELLRREEIHVVMTDQRMPEMTGVQLLSNIRGESPDAIRLLFTGYADIRAVIDAINQGNVYRYITKPWDPDELQSVIREACEHYDLLVERKRLLVELRVKNNQLQDANTQLIQANQLKSAFIQVASHELRTPLAILLGLSSLAQRGHTLSDDTRDFIGRIEQAGQRLQKLVNQLVSMLAAGKFDTTLDRKAVDVGELLRQAARDVQPFVDLRRQILEVTAAPGSITADREKLRDSLNHLLLNAIKFTADGGTIQLSATRRDDGTVELQVADSGVGIPPECLPRLFEPFFTGFDVSKHSSGDYEFGRRGIGLGLSVVKAFIELHGGSVKVQSELNKGSTFTIVLPGDP